MTGRIDDLSELSDGDRVVWDGQDDPVTVEGTRGEPDIGTLAVDVRYSDGEREHLLTAPVGLGDCLVYSTREYVEGLRRIDEDADGG